jgi:pimeloyl-ACP methyl ester carboxylesterase
MPQDITVETTGARLAARVHDGPDRDATTLVLHHGLASTQHIWDLMVPMLTPRFRVVTYDARGHGESSKPATGYDFAQITDDARAVLRATRSGRPVFVGHSWGAMAALELAARHPRAVRGFVLVDGGVTTMRDAFPSWAAARSALAPPKLAGTPLEEFRAMIPRFVGDAYEVTPEVEAIILSVMRVRSDGTIAPRLARANHFKILRAIWEQDPPASYRRVRASGLAISAIGSDPDWDVRRRAAVRALRDTGAPVRLASIRGVHDLPVQHPRTLARRISAFARTAVG